MASTQGHRENILTDSHTYVGIGSFTIYDAAVGRYITCWIQIFGNDTNLNAATPTSDRPETTYSIDVKLEDVTFSASPSSLHLHDVDSTSLPIIQGKNTQSRESTWYSGLFDIGSAAVAYTVADESIAVIEGDIIKPVGTGTTTLTAQLVSHPDKSVEIPVVVDEHSYIELELVEATCTEDGYGTYQCEICGDTHTDIFPATGHAFGNWFVAQAPTVDAEGVERRDCANCDHFETRSIAKLVPPEQVAFSGLPENSTVRVGDSFTLVPSIDEREGEDGWVWDSRFLSATFNSPATFTALQEGHPVITYTAANGTSVSVELTILAAESTKTPDDSKNPDGSIAPDSSTVPDDSKAPDGSTAPTGSTNPGSTNIPSNTNSPGGSNNAGGSGDTAIAATGDSTSTLGLWVALFVSAAGLVVTATVVIVRRRAKR